tara:strand:- start:226 stop:750 length:525 start_codon:yes stop_codon:yes gene_type:complete
MSYVDDLTRVEAQFALLLTERYVPVSNMNVKECKEFCKKRKLDTTGITEKSELVEMVRGARPDECSICLLPLLKNQWVKTTPCAHQFHWACLGEAVLARAGTPEAPRTVPIACPLCRADLRQLPKKTTTAPQAGADAGNRYYNELYERVRRNSEARGVPNMLDRDQASSGCNPQ